MGITSDQIDWFPSHAEVARSRVAKGGTAPGRDFVNFLWPAGLAYQSPLSPVFLSELSGPQFLTGAAAWLVRDGLVPLLWFFRQFRAPSDFRCFLLVNHELIPYVPTVWRQSIGQYSMQSDPGLYRGRKPKGLLLTGIMMDAYCSLDGLEEKLDAICRQLGSSKAGLEQVLAFLPQRLDGFGVEHRHDYLIDYVAVLSRFFGSKLKGITWNRFESSDSWAGYGVCDLNNKLVCADSYMLHRAMGLGAVLFGEKPVGAEQPAKPERDDAKRAGSKWVRLSPYHGIQISLNIGGKCALDDGSGLPEEMSQEFERRFLTAMRSEAMSRFPWPNWFAHWAQTLPAKVGREH